MSSSADELELLERVFLRLGTTETDQQLENVLCRFLPPVLLKLSSPHEEVRKKVMDILMHINKRLKTRPKVQLPVEALLNQYKDPEATSFVTNFSFIYIKMGFPRLPLEKKCDLFPTVLNALKDKPQMHVDSLLFLLLPILGEIKVSKLKEVPYPLRSEEKSELKKHLLGYLLDVLLLPYGALEPQPGNNTASITIPPAMSELSFKRVTSNNTPMTAAELEKVKIGIVKFISQGIFKNEDIILHLSVASADTRCEVAELSETELRRIDRSVDWNSSSLMLPIYIMFLGSQGNTRQDQKKSPASLRLRLKLFELLIKAKGDGFIFPLCIQVVFDSLYGNNSHRKLRASATVFLYVILRHANKDALGKFASILLEGLRKYTSEGEDKITQCDAFGLIGQLAQKFPNIVYHNFSLLEHFMNNLEGAPENSQSSIRTGFLDLITAYKYDFDPETADHNGRLELIFALAKSKNQSQDVAVRFVCVKILATIFPSDHVPSKLLLLQACGDMKEEVSSEAYVSLYGTSRKEDINFSNKNDKHVTLPSFTKIMKYIADENKNLDNNDSQTKSLPYPVEVYKEIIIYVRLCLIQDANVTLVRDIMNHPCEDTPIIAEHLRAKYDEPSKADSEAFYTYLKLCRKLLIMNSAIEALSCLVEAIGCLPKYSNVLSKDTIWIRDSLLSSTRPETREYAAILFGLLMTNVEYNEFEENVRYLLKQTSHRTLEVQHGAILAVGSCLETRLRNKKENLSSLLTEAICVLNNFLVTPNVQLTGAACSSLGIVACCISLPLYDGVINESPDAKKPATETVTKANLVINLLNILNDKKLNTKLKEKAARCLGLLCVGERFPHTKHILEGLLELARETKDVEVHFTIGESLVMGIQSIYSPEARNKWFEKFTEFQPDENDSFTDENLDWLLSQLLKISDNTNPNSRQASSIWLLAVTKNCGKREPITKRLDVLQNTFLGFLGDNNDIIQDVAAKALCVFYDTYKSEDLLSALVQQLTVGARQVQQVSSDTKLFENGQLGSSPTGGNLTTYKELCSLASDLNKPDLIYQFMQLANHNSMWNSKKGAAFGFSTIAKKCGEELKKYLPDIIPKLYRYQYDPSPHIQNSMINIWRVLVPDNQKVVEQYFHEILKDLLENLNSSQYRVRQSCCLAVHDLLRSSGNKSVHDAVDCMNDLWIKLFRVMDDHHEETRIVAKRTAKDLGKLCVQACDKTQGKAGIKMINAILPPLLETGVMSSVREIRLLSLCTIGELVDSCGEQLKPFLPTIIPALLRATQELESVKLSYLSTRLGGTQTQELLDDARASMVKSYLTIDTINKCTQYIDAPIVEELVPNIIELMKNSVGLTTRIACSHCIELLVVHRSEDMQPFTKKLISVLSRGLKDRNTAIRKQYARAIGFVASAAKKSTLEKFVHTLDTWYIEAKEPTIKTSVAYTVQAISAHSPNAMKDYSDVLLPLIFFALHDDENAENTSTSHIWEELWSDHTPGTEAGIRQNLSSIIDTIKFAFKSPYWSSKAQAANTINTMANKLGSTIDIHNLNDLIEVLLENLQGRTWNGKHKLLKALASICTNCKSSLIESGELKTRIAEASLAQCMKENIEYKLQAIKCLGDVLSSLELDKFEDVYKIVKSILNGFNDEDKEETDLSAEEIVNKREINLQLKAASYETLGKSWVSTSKETQEKYRELFVEHCVTFLPRITRNVQVSVLEALYNYVQNLKLLSEENLCKADEESLNSIIDNILQSMNYSLGVSKFTRLRKEALNIIICLLKKLRANERIGEISKIFSMLEQTLPELDNDTAPEIKSRLIEIRVLLAENK